MKPLTALERLLHMLDEPYEIERFEREHPEIPVYRVDVVGDRAVSQAIACA